MNCWSEWSVWSISFANRLRTRASNIILRCFFLAFWIIFEQRPFIEFDVHQVLVFFFFFLFFAKQMAVHQTALRQAWDARTTLPYGNARLRRAKKRDKQNTKPTKTAIRHALNFIEYKCTIYSDISARFFSSSCFFSLWCCLSSVAVGRVGRGVRWCLVGSPI